MRIDEQLNLVFTVDRPGEATVYVHAASIGHDAYDRYWRLLGQTFTHLMRDNLLDLGPKFAAKMLREIAEEGGRWAGAMGGEGLMQEIRRLTNVAAPGAGNGAGRGWQIIPYDDARREGLIDRQDAEAIENALVFFMLALHVIPQSWAPSKSMLAALSDAQTSSLSLSEYVASLPTSTATGSFGVMPPAPSSPPSSTGLPPMDGKPASGTGARVSSLGVAAPNIAIAS